MFFQRQFLSRIAAWHLRTLYSCSSTVTNRVLAEDLRLGVSVKLVSSTSTKPISSFSSPFTIPLLQTSISRWISSSGICRDGHYCNPNGLVRLPQVSIPYQIQELIFPFHPPNVDTVIGDQESHECTVGDDIDVDALTVAFSSVLKKRHQKMSKHKYRKRRKLDVFKRRHLENTKERKRRAKERKEERIKRQEASG